MDKALRNAIGIGRRKIGRDQSTFIRLAIVEKLKILGVPVDESLAYPPDRERPDPVNLAKVDDRIHAAGKKVARIGRIPHKVSPV